MTTEARTRPYDPAGHTKHALIFHVRMKDGQEKTHRARVVANSRLDFRQKVKNMAYSLPLVLDNAHEIIDVKASPEGSGRPFVFLDRAQIGLRNPEEFAA